MLSQALSLLSAARIPRPSRVFWCASRPDDLEIKAPRCNAFRSGARECTVHGAKGLEAPFVIPAGYRQRARFG